MTGASDPPPVVAGWFAEPARLTEDFQIDQRGDRWVVLVRKVGRVETPAGPLLDCEFPADRTSA